MLKGNDWPKAETNTSTHSLLPTLCSLKEHIESSLTCRLGINILKCINERYFSHSYTNWKFKPHLLHLRNCQPMGTL